MKQTASHSLAAAASALYRAPTEAGTQSLTRPSTWSPAGPVKPAPGAQPVRSNPHLEPSRSRSNPAPGTQPVRSNPHLEPSRSGQTCTWSPAGPVKPAPGAQPVRSNPHSHPAGPVKPAPGAQPVRSNPHRHPAGPWRRPAASGRQSVCSVRRVNSARRAARSVSVSHAIARRDTGTTPPRDMTITHRPRAEAEAEQKLLNHHHSDSR